MNNTDMKNAAVPSDVVAEMGRLMYNLVEKNKGRIATAKGTFVVREVTNYDTGEARDVLTPVVLIEFK